MATQPIQFDDEHFYSVFSNIPWGARIKEILRRSVRRRSLGLVARVPGLGGARMALDRAELQPLRSNSRFLSSFYRAPYGTIEKPSSLSEVPWDYVEKMQDDIPFLGLREYWYPTVRSSELAHNEPKPWTILGDNVVMFRQADGTPAALENRCPHRGVMLSLGQVGVWSPGTLTCRYHGMTFDGKGNCLAFLADGPDSPACGKIRAKSYPVTEQCGVVWIYMGDEAPPPLLENLPHADTVLGSGDDGLTVMQRQEIPYSYLNMLDNTVDMTHVGCLHRTCLMFGDQKPAGGVDFEELPGNGIRAFLKESGGHAGGKHIDKIEWYVPNLVYHGSHMMGGNMHGGWFWFVPKDVGSFWAWQIATINVGKVGRFKANMLARFLRMALDSGEKPGTACFIGGDAPMQLSQGRVARWDLDQLARTDRAVVRVRSMMKMAHRAEVAARSERGKPAPRLRRPAEQMG